MQPSMFPLPFDAQGNLILTGIKAPNGSWSLNKDGSLIVHDITLNALDTETAITIHGSDIDPELYNNKARGLITLVLLPDNSTGIATEDIVGKLVFTDYVFGRSYEVGALLHMDMQDANGTFVAMHIRYAWDTDATLTSPILANWQWGGRSTSSSDTTETGIFLFDESDLGTTGTDLHLTLTFDHNAAASGTGKYPRVQGETYTRMWISDAGYKQTRNSYSYSGGTSPPTTHVKTYNANGSASFQNDGTNRAGFDGGHCFQGYYSSTNGNQFSMVTFPYATIQSDLSGATITKTEVYLKNLFWFNNSGGTAVIGTHNQTSVTGDHAYSQVTDNINQASFSYGQGKWVTVNNSIGNAFKNNTAKGIALGKGQSVGGTLSNSHVYYGYFAGNGQSGEPQLRITYTK